MDVKLYKVIAGALKNYSMPDRMTVPDAIGFACFVIDKVNKGESCVTADSIIDKGIMLHAMRQLDHHHQQAGTILDNFRNA